MSRSVIVPKPLLVISAFALSTLALPALGEPYGDPVSEDPPIVHQQHPPVLVETSFHSHGSRLNAIMYLAQGAGPHPTVVLLHGFPGNEKNLDLAQAIRRAGLNVLFFHYRGSWGSEGEFSFAHCLEDVDAALAFLRTEESRQERRVDPDRIAIVGHSLGGLLALTATAADPGVHCAGSISGVNLAPLAQLLQGSPELDGAVAAALQQGTGPLRGTSGRALLDEIVANPDRFDLLEQVDALGGHRLLLVAGYRDTSVPLANHHQPLVEALEKSGHVGTTELVLDTDHAFSGKRITLARAVVAWLQQRCGY